MNPSEQTSAPTVDVAYVARLARLALTPEETTQFQRQLADILAYVGQLGELDVEGVEPTAHAAPARNVFREDVARPGLPVESALANAPTARQGLFVVPKIVE